MRKEKTVQTIAKRGEKLPDLPPIYLDGKPYDITGANIPGKTVTAVNNSMAPKVLKWMYARLEAFIAYTDAGYVDPVGAQCFRFLAPAVVKLVKKPSKQASRGQGEPEGDSARAYVEYLKQQRIKLAGDAVIIDRPEKKPLKPQRRPPSEPELPNLSQHVDDF